MALHRKYPKAPRIFAGFCASRWRGFHLSLGILVVQTPATPAAPLLFDPALVSWSYSASDNDAGVIGSGSSFGLQEVDAPFISEGAGFNLDPDETSIVVGTDTQPSVFSGAPSHRIQGIVGTNGGRVSGRAEMVWSAQIIDKYNPSAAPVDVPVVFSGGYSVLIGAPLSNFDGDTFNDVGGVNASAQANIFSTGYSGFPFQVFIASDVVCFIDARCITTTFVQDSFRIETSVTTGTSINFSLSAGGSAIGPACDSLSTEPGCSVDDRFGFLVFADPSISFLNPADAALYEIAYSGNLVPKDDLTTPPAPIPLPPTAALLGGAFLLSRVLGGWRDRRVSVGGFKRARA